MVPLQISNFTKKYNKFVAVDSLNLDLYPGEVFGLLGPNGAGKTTLISSIVTLQKGTEGTIKIFGYDVNKDPKITKSFIGFVPQELIQYGFFTVHEIVKFHVQYHGLHYDSQYVEYLLKKLHLWYQKDKLVSQLSGGMKRRLLIIKALVHRPKILLLDEPTAGVDTELRAIIWEFIEELKQQDMTILLTTHYLDEARVLCDRIGIINNGMLLNVGGTEELIADFSSKKVVITLLQNLKSCKSRYLKQLKGSTIEFIIPNEMTIKNLLDEAKIILDQIIDIKVTPGSLEDVMSKVIKEVK